MTLPEDLVYRNGGRSKEQQSTKVQNSSKNLWNFGASLGAKFRRITWKVPETRALRLLWPYHLPPNSRSVASSISWSPHATVRVFSEGGLRRWTDNDIFLCSNHRTQILKKIKSSRGTKNQPKIWMHKVFPIPGRPDPNRRTSRPFPACKTTEWGALRKVLSGTSHGWGQGYPEVWANVPGTSCPKNFSSECTKIAHRRSLAIFTADEGIARKSAARTIFIHKFSSQKKSRFASDFLRRGNRASWGLEKSRDDCLGSGKSPPQPQRIARF